jgi:hypothetical protein
LAAIAPILPGFAHGIGIKVGDAFLLHVLKLAAALATAGAAFTRRWRFIAGAVAGEVALWELCDVLPDSDNDLAALHLAFFGLLAGAQVRTLVEPWSNVAAAPPGQRPIALWVEDACVFGAGVLLGSIVCWVLLHGQTTSGDEWADTYQAALFAKGHAYAKVPKCADALRSYWVFQYEGRAFAQYTPGWPYFMTPFIWLHAPWLAGPASLGVAAAGVGRLGRRAAAELGPTPAGPSSRFARTAGRFAAAALLTSSTVLINGGSRYPHLFVGAMFAWSVEAACAIASAGLSRRAQWGWGTVLGTAASLAVASRPGDGVAISSGVAAYFVFSVVRRRVGWRSAAGAAASGALIVGLTLVVLRLQLGRWGVTAYALTEKIYPWARVAWGLPQPNEYKHAVPLATGAYCWFPCSPAVGLAGLAALRGRSRRIAFMLGAGGAAILAFYTVITLGRSGAPGYGPRYILPCIVPMATGTGVILAAAWVEARDSAAGAKGGPLAICATAVGLGVMRLALLLYPFTFADVRLHNRLADAIAAAKLRDAVVFAAPGLSNTDSMDLTENFPLDFYKNQDVLIAIDTGPDGERCVEESFPNRAYYRATPGDSVKFSPLEPAGAARTR